MAFELPSLRLKHGDGNDAHSLEQFPEAKAQAEIPNFDEVSGRYPFLDSAECVFVAGSVVLGWAHAASDLDMYVISEKPLTPGDDFEVYQRSVTTSNPSIAIAIGEVGRYRADFEFWTIEQVDEVLARFGHGPRDQESDGADPTEQDMLYRLSVSRLMHGSAWWMSRRERLAESSYGQWLTDSYRLRAESNLEDVAGMIESEDRESAILAAREAFVLSLEALLATYGDLSINRKWLYRRLQAAGAAEIAVDVAWRTLTLSDLADSKDSWAAHTATQAQQLLIAAERRSA